MDAEEETLEYDDITEEEYWEWVRELIFSVVSIEEMFEEPELSKYLTQAREEGAAKGKAEGKAEGARNQAVLLRRVLEEKFGSLSVEHVEELFNADLEQLAIWSDRVFEVDSLKEVFQ
ncbi:hypothetical protein ACQZV8_20865 [Magnetococcales bacterium HHB-1]